MAASYAQALRVVGQALESWHLEDFDLEGHGNDFLVRGVKRDAPRGGNLLGAVQRLLFRKPTAHTNFVMLHYTPEEIDRLEQEGRAQRTSASGMPDLSSLSQVLRALGTYVDGKGGRLLAIRRKQLSPVMQSIKLEYQTYQGEVKKEEHETSAMYDLAVHMYMQRKKRPDIAV
jgi:hypothetical protein